MITKQDPTQPKLWSRFQDLLSDVALEELDRGWQGVFHRMILQQLPVEIMEEKFNKYTGRPSRPRLQKPPKGIHIPPGINTWGNMVQRFTLLQVREQLATSCSYFGSSLIVLCCIVLRHRELDSRESPTHAFAPANVVPRQNAMDLQHGFLHSGSKL